MKEALRPTVGQDMRLQAAAHRLLIIEVPHRNTTERLHLPTIVEAITQHRQEVLHLPIVRQAEARAVAEEL